MRRLGSDRWKVGVLRMPQLFGYALKVGCGLWMVCSAQATVNVSFSGTQAAVLQQEFISATTGQYLSTLTPNPFFKDTYSLTITGKNPAYQPSVCPTPGVSPTTPFEYGWGFGVEAGEKISMNRISNYILNCSTPAYFGASTTTWSAGSCSTALMAAESDIYSLQFSTPPVLPVMP